MCRGSGFCQIEVDRMLDAIERYLPLCREEWDAVLKLHEHQFKDSIRTTDSLKRKFSSMHRKKMPTGDPLMTDDVRRAKHIRYKMTDRADMGVAEDADEVVESFMPCSKDTQETESETLHVEAPSTESDDFGDVQSVVAPIVIPDSPETITPSPRPLINRRSGGSQRHDDSADIFAIMKANMVQEQERREEEAKRREEDRNDERIRREDERREEKLRREYDTIRHDKFMEMMMMVMTQQNSPHSSTQRN